MANSTALLENQHTTQSSYRWLIIITVMVLAILEVLDSTIVNVALPSMMGSLGADQSQITWVLTSYIVASAVVLPLTGYLTNVLGRKNLLFICASGFMLSSFLCGISTSLSEMIIFRVIQGMCGSCLIPISQTILRETFPLEEQGKAMAIWGIGILAAPVFGPTLGGFITEHSTWRWVFYINLPFCLISLGLIAWVIPKTKIIRQNLDVLGLILMAVGVATLQIFLDKGNEHGWFTSNIILILCVTAMFCLTYFIIYSATKKNPLINLRLYKNRNFSLCCFLMLLFCASVFSFITLQPLLLENYFGYSAMKAGMTMAPMGIMSAIGMVVSSKLMYKMKVKYLLCIAMLISCAGLWYESQLSLQATNNYFMICNSFIGLGMGLFTVPLSTYVFSTLNKSDLSEAAGLFSYSRMLGTSIGISLTSTLVSRVSQVGWQNLGRFITPFNANVTHWLAHQHLTSLTPVAVARLSHTLAMQSGLLGFIAAFKTLAIVLILQIPVALTLKSVKLESKP